MDAYCFNINQSRLAQYSHRSLQNSCSNLNYILLDAADDLEDTVN
jgi:hypothetical protein